MKKENQIPVIADPFDPDRPLTSEKAAEWLGISMPSLYRLTSENRIPFYKPLGGKFLIFRRSDLIEFAYRNRVSPDDELHQKAERILNT